MPGSLVHVAEAMNCFLHIWFTMFNMKNVCEIVI